MRKILSDSSFVFVIMSITILVSIPSLQLGWILDDIFARAAHSDNDKISSFAHISDPFEKDNNFYCFFSYKYPEMNKAKIDKGVFPWWTDKDLELRFFRPITDLTLLLDYKLWPDNPWLMHAHQTLWFFFLILAVFFFFRNFFEVKWLGAAATLLFLLNKCHFIPIIYLANRHTIIAAFFGVLSLLFHHKYINKNCLQWQILASIAFTLSCFSSELGISTIAFLFASTIFIDPGNLNRKIKNFFPYILIFIIWTIIYIKLGFKSGGSDDHISPVSMPVEFIKIVILRFPVYFFSLISGFMVSLLYTLPANLQNIISIIFYLCLLPFALISGPVIRKNNQLKYWLLGIGCSIIPLCTVTPDDRVMVFGSLGAIGFLVCFISVKYDSRNKNFFRKKNMNILVYIFLSLNILTGIVGFIYGPRIFKETEADNTRKMDFGNNPDIWNQDIILVNSPGNFVIGFYYIKRYFDDLPIPKSLRILSPGFMRTEIKILDDYTVNIKPEFGYFPPAASLSKKERKKLGFFDNVYLQRSIERYVVCSNTRFNIGEKIKIEGVTIEVVDLTSDGRIAEVNFHFDTLLYSETKKWLVWDKTSQAYTAFELPAMGKVAVLE